MTNEKVTYDFKSINLYGLEDIDFEKSLENILLEFKRLYLKDIKKYLKSIGLKLEEIKTYSPKEYNFEGDCIDLTISIKDKNKLKEAIIENKEYLNKELSKNKSYDGYIALGVSDVKEEIEKLEQKDYSPDCLILYALINKNVNLEEFNYLDYIIFEGGD